MIHKLTFREKIKAFKLTHNMWACALLLVSCIITTFLYAFLRNSDGFAPELMLALSTSLLASLLCLISDIYVQFKNSEKDQLLEGMHEFGIKDLHFNKKELLENLLQSCRNELYLSGYRLILLDKLSNHLTQAISRGASARVLVSPSWDPSFQLVYGTKEKVADNYYRVFHSLYRGCQKNKNEHIVIRFINKPFFSDTYKVDEHLITGPYLHNKTAEDSRITASDFFTYDISQKSKLYTLVEQENSTLWEEASLELDYEAFTKAYDAVRNGDFNESEKLQLLKQACHPVTASHGV